MDPLLRVSSSSSPEPLFHDEDIPFQGLDNPLWHENHDLDVYTEDTDPLVAAVVTQHLMIKTRPHQRKVEATSYKPMFEPRLQKSQASGDCCGILFLMLLVLALIVARQPSDDVPTLYGLDPLEALCPTLIFPNASEYFGISAMSYKNQSSAICNEPVSMKCLSKLSTAFVADKFDSLSIYSMHPIARVPPCQVRAARATRS